MGIDVMNHREYATAGGDKDTETLWLQSVDPDKILRGDYEVNRKGLRLQKLNVPKLSMYTTREGRLLIIHPERSTMTYKTLAEAWPWSPEPWAFVVRENYYDELDESEYFFRYGMEAQDGQIAIPVLDIKDWRTR